MHVAIVHYHLQPGGVTRIIEHSIAALAGRGISVVVLTGKAPGPDFPAPFMVIPSLQYEGQRPDATPSALLADMKNAALEAFGVLPDIWHVHNHSLGKNVLLPRVLYDLAAEGQHLLLQTHDFAEDGRPANYFLMLEKMAAGNKRTMSRYLYPDGEHVHFAVLNGRDFSFLLDAGTRPDCLHLLANPVKVQSSLVDLQVQVDEHLFLYPTRAIRRKNLGEFLLWSAIGDKGDHFATTMGPENPRERPRYEEWQRFAARLELPVEFELGRRMDSSFAGLLKRARTLVTTSVAEGFGLAFLEPWLVERPICGRDLPEITMEFRDEGIQLSQLYERLDIPVQWIGRGRILDCAAAGQERSLEAYGRQPTVDCLERTIAAWIRDDHVDFGRLNEEMQQQVIEHLVRYPEEASHLRPKGLPAPEHMESSIVHNKKILEEKYSLQGYGDRLLKIYKRIAESSVTALDALDGEQLLDHFLAPERLNLLRVD